jgi:SepF-like predicted cell division protein (DUF552 family)
MFDKIKRALSTEPEEFENDYIELDLGMQEDKDKKVQVKLFNLHQYEDVTEILNSLREGFTIATIDIKHLKQKDPIELKRAISKIKKTADALEGQIAGFGENTVIVTPSFATISKQAVQQPKTDEQPKHEFE